VKHRADQLLQRSAEAFKSQGVSGDAVRDNNAAIRAALLDFVDKRLLGSPFVDRGSLELALSEWPTYAFDQGIRHLDIWDDLMYLDGEIRTRRIGLGGPFVCAMVQEVEAEEPSASATELDMLGLKALFARAKEAGLTWEDIEAAVARKIALMESEVRTNWAEVVTLNPQGYVEMNDGKRLVHGPIKGIEIDGTDNVLIELEWAATCLLGATGLPVSDEWQLVTPLQPVVFPNFVVPFLIEDTPEKGPRVRFGGLNILYINKIEGLDPAKVKGLVIG
jgi:hypothetical protein